MLLQPINSSEDYCRGLKLNAYVTDPRHYQICENSPKCWVHSRIKSVDVMDSWINRFCWEMRMSTLVNYVQDDLMFVILLSYHNLHKWVLYTGDPWNKKMLAQQSESLWMLPSLRFLICFCWLLIFVNYFPLIICTFLIVFYTDIWFVEVALFSKSAFNRFLLQQRIVWLHNFFSLWCTEEYEHSHKAWHKRIRWCALLCALGNEILMDFIFNFLIFPLGNVIRILRGNYSHKEFSFHNGLFRWCDLSLGSYKKLFDSFFVI